MSKSYYVYILKCSDSSFYTGVTSDIDKRLFEHNQGTFRGYTKNRKPVELVFNEIFNDINEAIRAEHQIKGWSRAKKIALINRDFDLLKPLSKKKWNK